MIRIARAVLAVVRAVSALACMGFSLVEILRLVGPANVPGVGPLSFLELAIAAIAVWGAAHVTDVALSRLSRRARLGRLDRLNRLDRRRIELGAAARPKVVDLNRYRRLAGRGDRRRSG